MITFNEIKNNKDIRTLISAADQSLAALGFTDHSFAHVGLVSERAGDILDALGAEPREVELTRIAGYLHDIGNLVNRTEHSQSGAVMAFRILDKMGMDMSEIATVVTAIGNHDEGTGVPVSRVAAAIILADKSDVRRSRVRNTDFATFDIHDRVNYSVKRADLDICKDKNEIELKLVIDIDFCSVMEYFEIFLGRMKLCSNAAAKLGLRFRLSVNDQIML